MQGAKLLGSRIPGEPKIDDGNPNFGQGFPIGNPDIGNPEIARINMSLLTDYKLTFIMLINKPAKSHISLSFQNPEKAEEIQIFL